MDNTRPQVRTERIGSTLLITIDRPTARNAVNAAVAAARAGPLVRGPARRAPRTRLCRRPGLVCSASRKHPLCCGQFTV